MQTVVKRADIRTRRAAAGH